jgi:hypothetical protein
MPLMVLNLSKPPFDIGARRVGIRDGHGKYQADQPFVIMREVTQAEWIAYCRAECGPKWPTLWQITTTKDDRFFEVATD